MGDSPVAYVCPSVRRIWPEKPQDPGVAGSISVPSYPIGTCRVQTILAWISQGEWVDAFKEFQHNETPTCIEGEILLVPPYYYPRLSSILPDYPTVRLVDKCIPAMDGLEYLRRSSAMVLYAPIDSVCHPIKTLDTDGLDERATVTSAHLLISIISCIGYCDQEKLRRDLPPVSKISQTLPSQPNRASRSMGSATFKKGREAEIKLYLSHMNGYLPDCSIFPLNLRKGSIIADISATERDGFILKALFESGVCDYLVRDEKNKKKKNALRSVSLSSFDLKASGAELPLYYSGFSDEILRLGRSNDHSQRNEAWRSMRKWMQKKSIERIATALAQSQSLSDELSNCG
jgi:hypothetical protein